MPSVAFLFLLYELSSSSWVEIRVQYRCGENGIDFISY